MFDICLVMLIGVPGSGKTSLSQTLVTYLEGGTSLDSCVAIPICYDSLIPANLEDQLPWKEARKSILHDVQQLVNYLKNFELENSTRVSQWSHVAEKILKTANKGKRVQAVIIVDDNMYYRSMRYEYYQLARQNALGFCQVYIHCDLDDALKRNESRDTSVPAAIVRKMFTNIEPPDEKLHYWEKASVTVESSAISEPEVLASITGLISTAIQDPVLPKQDFSKLREESQIICSTTVLHQSDLALRRLVAEEINKAKQLGMKGSEVGAKAAYLGEVRKKLLNDIRMSVHLVPTDVAAAVELHDPAASSELQHFLSTLFSLQMNEQTYL